MANQYGNCTVYDGRDFYLHDKKYNIDEIIKYYIEENHSKIETNQHFGINNTTLIRIFKHYGVKKPKLLSYEHNKKTNLERYGDPNYNNMEQYKKTCLEKYGVDNYFKDVERMKQVYLNKFGVINPNKLTSVVEKRKKTNLERYGVESYSQTAEYREKTIATLTKHYGEGVTAPMKSEVVKSKYNFKKNAEKAFDTKLKNGTTNTSKPEKEMKEFLVNIFGEQDILCQYKNELYPYHCDFYIKSLNMYVELNLYFTHGGHPFDSDNVDDLKKLDIWKQKAQTSKFYENAINIWTHLDVNKIQLAKDNNLNYTMIYNMEQYEDFKNYIKGRFEKC